MPNFVNGRHDSPTLFGPNDAPVSDDKSKTYTPRPGGLFPADHTHRRRLAKPRTLRFRALRLHGCECGCVWCDCLSLLALVTAARHASVLASWLETLLTTRTVTTEYGECRQDVCH